jgi:ribosomal protein S25
MGGERAEEEGKKERKRKKRKGERKDSYSRIPIAEQEKITSHVHSDKCLRIYLEK